MIPKKACHLGMSTKDDAAALELETKLRRLHARPKRTLSTVTGTVVRKVFFGSLPLVALTIASPVYAADLSAAKAPVYSTSPAPAFSWAGFYAGANIGGDWATSKVTAAVDPVGLGGNGPGTVLLNQQGSGSMTGAGVIGGLQAGYDWQIHNIVFGIEGDVDALHASKTVTANFACAGFGGGACTYQQEFDQTFFATLRQRFGLALDRWLVYATDGVAVARWSTMDSLTISAAPPPSSISGSKTAAGWTVGGGIEYAWTDHWLVGLDYLYADFGRLSTTAPSAFGAAVNTDINYRHSLTENLVRLDLSYKFGD